ncbi:hypothetical protein KMZ93_15720 [Bradyrhizobium sediminis]|uniref:Uncharacterized protein n=1 Tax=Bradyrhizobium sediminis TaxID=2840469 RepID=A0A975NVF4_9BRAD|nr:hypothetical protein [Bradyrhizobium sediminis]QWG21461.1 hypothetical protein KMZ93_15720 [Bradyrhizobium sediminis]
MTIAEWKDLAAIFQSVVTPIALIAGGIWAYRRYIVEENNFPHIETSAEIAFIGQQGDYWIVELVAVLNNKGKVQHKIEKFGFNLNALYSNDPVGVNKKWGGQVDFTQAVAKGSFIPKDFQYFVVGPSVTARYSYVARVPKLTTYLNLHCWFDYADGRGFSHTMEKTVQTPR